MCIRQDPGRARSILQYATLILVVYQVCHCVRRYVNKCSAVAKMGNPLTTIDMNEKRGAAVPLSEGRWVESPQLILIVISYLSPYRPLNN